jgi:hypothetical protein
VCCKEANLKEQWSTILIKTNHTLILNLNERVKMAGIGMLRGQQKMISVLMLLQL